MSLPAWVSHHKDWPLENPEERACGIGCDMGEAGPGPRGQHDADCTVVRIVEALSIAWEALEQIEKMEGRFNMDHFQHAKNTIEDNQKYARETLRRIEEMGK
jgi:hypothetical protein